MVARESWPTGLLVGIAVALGATLGGIAEAPEDAGGAGLVARADRAEVVEASACRSRSDCGPQVMGGLQITFTGWLCTSGFGARDTRTQMLEVLTAGHCLARSGLSALWLHHGVAIGRASVDAFRPGSNADVGAIEITGSHPSNEVYGASSADIRSVTGWAANSSQTVGSKVCRSGGASGWRCGSVVDADMDATLDGILIHHTWWTDFPSESGDSGGPLLDRDGRAAGIVIATTQTQSVYATVDWIATELHARPCLDVACD